MELKHLILFENYNQTFDQYFLDEVLEGYLECALWTEEMDDNIIDDIVNRFDCRVDIEMFLSKLQDAGLLSELKNKLEPGQIGHDFWLTRNGHGAGFWDRNLDELGDKVTKICKEFPEKYVVVGDDEKIYIE